MQESYTWRMFGTRKQLTAEISLHSCVRQYSRYFFLEQPLTPRVGCIEFKKIVAQLVAYNLSRGCLTDARWPRQHACLEKSSVIILRPRTYLIILILFKLFHYLISRDCLWLERFRK